MRLNPATMQALAEECDFFLTMGVSDANPTTILESMAWGFPVACTPQSGYDGLSEITTLSITDMQHNLDTLDRLQGAPDAELLDQADLARKRVESCYTFERMTGTVVSTLERLLAARRETP